MFPASQLHPKLNEILRGDGKFEEVVENLIALSRAISCDTKIGIILTLLRDGERAVSELANALNKDVTLVSHHLSDLKKLGFVRERKIGKMRIYSLREDKLEVIKGIVSSMLG